MEQRKVERKQQSMTIWTVLHEGMQDMGHDHLRLLADIIQEEDGYGI